MDHDNFGLPSERLSFTLPRIDLGSPEPPVEIDDGARARFESRIAALAGYAADDPTGADAAAPAPEPGIAGTLVIRDGDIVFETNP